MAAPSEGEDASGLRFAIVVARFNAFITDKLLEGALATLRARGVAEEGIEVWRVPGAFEIPVVAQAAAESGRVDAVLCLGAVIRGETEHYELVAQQAARGIGDVSLKTGVPCIFEVLATPTLELAVARGWRRRGQ